MTDDLTPAQQEEVERIRALVTRCILAETQQGRRTYEDMFMADLGRLMRERDEARRMAEQGRKAVEDIASGHPATWTSVFPWEGSR